MPALDAFVNAQAQEQVDLFEVEEGAVAGSRE
jgi:hypothetical protein